MFQDYFKSKGNRQQSSSEIVPHFKFPSENGKKKKCVLDKLNPRKRACYETSK